MTTGAKASCHIPSIRLTLPSPSELLKKGRCLPPAPGSVRLQVYGVFLGGGGVNSQSSCPVGWLVKVKMTLWSFGGSWNESVHHAKGKM